MPDAFVVAADIRQATGRTMTLVGQATRKAAQLGLGKVRANASGRPGPRRITGDYVRKMNIRKVAQFDQSIGTDAVQARRLENGFVGVDSLGRHYNQPPYPHWGPMADWIGPQFAQLVRDALKALS